MILLLHVYEELSIVFGTLNTAARVFVQQNALPVRFHALCYHLYEEPSLWIVFGSLYTTTCVFILQNALFFITNRVACAFPYLLLSAKANLELAVL